MQGLPSRPPGAAASGLGLRALAIRVAAVLAELSASARVQPAYASADVPTQRLHSAAGNHSATSNHSAAGNHSGARPASSTSQATSGEPPDADESIDADHVETWRLVTLAQQGDGEAFGQLYDRYVDAVFRFIYFRVNDRALAEDFTSETFLRALRRIGTISYQGRDIGAWFVTIARNIIFDHTKSARHRLEVTTADNLEGAVTEPGPEAAVLDLLTSERLMAAIRELGDEQRECVLLRFVQGFSVSETASVMGKNDGAIKALQHRAIRKLGEIVGDELR